MEKIRCAGCGAVIQSTDPLKPGYLPEKALKGDHDHLLCQRCFKLQHYHTKMESHLSQDDFLKVISAIGEKDCLVVYLVDLFDFAGSSIPGLMRHIGYNDVLVLANKRDILPASLKEHKLEAWVRRQLKAQGIKSVDVIITSGKKNLNFDEIYEKIDTYRHGRDVYVVGMTNVGKSTLINGLLKHYTSLDTQITTSEFPGTTLDLIKIPLDENSALYDTPGVVNTHSILERIDAKYLKTIIPQLELRPVSFQLNADQTIYFDGLARIDYVSGDKGSFIAYFSRELKLHRTKTINADALYDRHKELKLTLDEVKSIKDMKTYEYNIDGERKEIVIAGLGFISVKAKGKVKVKAPADIDVSIREPLI